MVDVMREIAADHEVSVAQIALSWLLHQPAVTSVIIGAKNDEQLTDNLATPEVELSAAELVRLNEVSALPPEACATTIIEYLKSGEPPIAFEQLRKRMGNDKRND